MGGGDGTMPPSGGNSGTLARVADKDREASISLSRDATQGCKSNLLPRYEGAGCAATQHKRQQFDRTTGPENIQPYARANARHGHMPRSGRQLSHYGEAHSGPMFQSAL